MLTGNLSGNISGGMGIATAEIARHLATVSNLLLIKSGDESFPSIKNVFTVNASTPAKQIVSYSVFPSSAKEVINYDFLISPYRTDEHKKIASFQTDASVLEVIEAVPPTYLEEVAFYNQKMAELAQTLVFDVIYCHDWITFQAGISLKLLTGKKLVLHIHSLETDRKPDNKNPNIYYLERKAMDYADAVIAVSEYTKKLIRKNYEIYPGKIQVVHNAFVPGTIKRQEKDTGEMNVLFMGRLSRQKGIDNFISIAEIVYQKYPLVQFIVAGDGELRTEIEERIENSIAADNINLLGFLETQEKNDLLGITDIFCMPSESEPFGLAGLEAASAGIPCVISKQSGISEILTSALKTDHDDVSGFALSIIMLLENESLRKSIAEEQLSEIKQLNWGKAAENIQRIIQNV
jgi:glycogen synthase